MPPCARCATWPRPPKSWGSTEDRAAAARADRGGAHGEPGHRRFGGRGKLHAAEAPSAQHQSAAPGSDIVFTLRSGKIVAVSIGTGLTDQDYTEVTSGLTDRDTVLVLSGTTPR